MNREIVYDDIEQLHHPLLIDLRSASEHEAQKIIGSVNFPIMNEEERAVVGTLYDRGEILEAKKKAVSFASYKLPELFAFIADHSKERDIVLYCARGGYRSTALFYFLNSLSIQVFKLKGGYKSYRKSIMKRLDKYAREFRFITLNGGTGVGKTKILKELEKMGANVLDLEGLAHHKGSLLGNLENRPQPSQKNFEAMIAHQFESFRGNTVFVECESYRIGEVLVPKALHDAYAKDGTQVLVELSMEERLQNIKEDYVFDDEAFNASLMESLDNLARFIGKKRVRNYRDKISEGNYDFIIEDLIVNYYDHTYKLRSEGYDYTLENSDPRAAAKNLMDKLSLPVLKATS